MKTSFKYVVLGLFMILAGWFANEVFKPTKASAAKTLEYKIIITTSAPPTATEMEKEINDNAKKGWRLHSITGSGSGDLSGSRIYER